MLNQSMSIIRWALSRELFAKGNGLPVRWVPSKSARLVLLLGDNATGKSLFRKAVGSWCGAQKPNRYELIGLSMAGRTDTYSGVVRGMIYGGESDQSTGFNTARTVTMGIKTALDRTEPHVLFWDEPDTGLSDNYAAGVGKMIADFAEKPGAPWSSTTRSWILKTPRRGSACLQESVPTAAVTPIEVSRCAVSAARMRTWRI